MRKSEIKLRESITNLKIISPTGLRNSYKPKVTRFAFFNDSHIHDIKVLQSKRRLRPKARWFTQDWNTLESYPRARRRWGKDSGYLCRPRNIRHCGRDITSSEFGNITSSWNGLHLIEIRAKIKNLKEEWKWEKKMFVVTWMLDLRDRVYNKLRLLSRAISTSGSFFWDLKGLVVPRAIILWNTQRTGEAGTDMKKIELICSSFAFFCSKETNHLWCHNRLRTDFHRHHITKYGR